MKIHVNSSCIYDLIAKTFSDHNSSFHRPLSPLNLSLVERSILSNPVFYTSFVVYPWVSESVTRLVGFIQNWANLIFSHSVWVEIKAALCSL